MKTIRRAARAALGLGAMVLMLGTLQVAHAHCDTIDGPVVTAAKKSLETGDVNLVLLWVRHEDESEIKELFGKTRQVRTLGDEAKSLADRYFFETVVRLHRAGEGVAYTGLKPPGSVEPGIAAADHSLETKSDEHLLHELTAAVQRGVHERFQEVQKRALFTPSDVDAGRAYVRSYVEFIHYVERVHNALSAPGHGEHGEAGGTVEH